MSRSRGISYDVRMPAHDVYTESETQKHTLGMRLQLGDRVFRYASSGAALSQGFLLESATVGGAATTAQIDLAVTAAVAGQTTLTVTTLTTAQTLNLFAEGYATVVSDTNAHGAGVAYRIKSHPVQTAAGSLVITLYDPIAKAITADCKVSLHTNLWKAVKHTAVTTAVGMPVGVPLIDVTSAYYFWCQTWGPAAVLTHSNVIVDSAMCRGLVEGRSIIQAAAGITPEIGYSIEAAAAADYPLTYLMIAP